MFTNSKPNPVTNADRFESAYNDLVNELEMEIADGKWDVVKLPVDLILEQKSYDTIWSSARNAIGSSTEQ